MNPFPRWVGQGFIQDFSHKVTLKSHLVIHIAIERPDLKEVNSSFGHL